jgi:DedD protein
VAVAPSEPAKVSPPPAPKPAPKPAAKPISPAPTASSTSSGYWIQTGSFIQKSSADALKKGFEDNNFSARINVKDIDGKSYYQVRVGPYTSREEAQKSLGSVKAIPGASSGSFVTQ